MFILYYCIQYFYYCIIVYNNKHNKVLLCLTDTSLYIYTTAP